MVTLLRFKRVLYLLLCLLAMEFRFSFRHGCFFRVLMLCFFSIAMGFLDSHDRSLAPAIEAVADMYNSHYYGNTALTIMIAVILEFS